MLEKGEEPGFKLHLPDSRHHLPTSPLHHSTPASPLSPRPLTLFLSCLSNVSKPQALGQFTDSDKSPAAFPLLLLLMGYYNFVNCLWFSCLAEAFSTYLSSLWREDCFTQPRERLKLFAATSVSTFSPSSEIEKMKARPCFLNSLSLSKM